jgi:hypothetical protein
MTIEKEITKKININELEEITSININEDFFLLQNGKKMPISTFASQLSSVYTNKMATFKNVMEVNWSTKTAVTNGYTVPKHGVLICQRVGNPCILSINAKAIVRWDSQDKDCLMGPYPVSTGDKITWTGYMEFIFFYAYTGN